MTNRGGIRYGPLPETKTDEKSSSYAGTATGLAFALGMAIAAVILLSIFLPLYLTKGNTIQRENFNIYWVGNSHGSGGEQKYRLDIRAEIGTNIHLDLPNSVSFDERYNDRWVNSDGYSKTELFASECNFQYVNGWSIGKVPGSSGFLYDYSICGACSTGNIRLSVFNQTVVGPEKYSAHESVHSFLNAMGTADFRPSDLIWFSANGNDINFIAVTLAGFPTNLPPGTTVTDIIGNATKNHVDLIDTLYQRGCKRMIVELWETIQNINMIIYQNLDEAFPGIHANIEAAVAIMVPSIKGAINAKLATDWVDMDLYFDDVSKHQLEVLSNLNKYGINPNLNRTMVDEIEDTGRYVRNLYHWDDTHLSQHSMQHIARFQCKILKRPLVDSRIGGL